MICANHEMDQHADLLNFATAGPQVITPSSIGGVGHRR
jgi:hypothetical protein